MGNISSKSVLLTYSGSLWIQYRQGLQLGKLSVCCWFFSSGFTFHLGHFPDFSPCVPGSPPYVPPVKQDSYPLRNHTGLRFMAGESDDRDRGLWARGPNIHQRVWMTCGNNSKLYSFRDLFYTDFNHGFIGLWFVCIGWVIEAFRRKKGISIFLFITKSFVLCEAINMQWKWNTQISVEWGESVKKRTAMFKSESWLCHWMKRALSLVTCADHLGDGVDLSTTSF